MSSLGWRDAPTATRAQVKALLRAFRQLLGPDLLAVYLHGSLAMGCFNPTRSDLDLLVVMESGMALETKRTIALMLLRLSAAPHPIEISFLRWQDFTPWRHPTPFVLHYSEQWRERVHAELASGAWRCWNEGEREDPDLAAHITITRERGIRLFGPPAVAVFPPVPPADYLASILYDFDASRDQIVADPIYGVLNLCRVYWYVLEGRISSKAEAGDWAMHALSPQFRALVRKALATYRGDSMAEQFAPEELTIFAAHMDALVTALNQTQGV